MTENPELRFVSTKNGDNKVAVTTARLAVNSRSRKTREGEVISDTVFVDCDIWSSAAETFVKYFKKGDGLLVEGSLQSDSWVDKDTGKKMSKLKVRCNRWSFPVGRKYDRDESSESETEGFDTNESSEKEEVEVGF